MGARRWTALLLCGALVFGIFPVKATAAAESENAAHTLYELGLFQGVGTDSAGEPIFDLERTPTRAEALVMLVRLLGKEAEVKAGTYQHPFTDVDAWAAPYVGYAYEHGLTTGTGAATFGGGSPADGNTYVTFVLRALGYADRADKPDFTYSEAVAFAKSHGLTDSDYADGFSRGDIADLSLSALAQPLKGETSTLVERLAAEGAVDRAAAEAAGVLAHPIVAEYEGTKLLAPCTYDAKGGSEITIPTILALLPDCRYVLTYFGWSAEPQTVRDHFLVALGYQLYSNGGRELSREDIDSIVTPKNGEQSTTYHFFVDKDYNILAYLDSTMLTPNKNTVPLETKVALDGNAVYKEVTATMTQKLGRAAEERFTVWETPYPGVRVFHTEGGRVDTIYDEEATIYPVLGEDAEKAAYVTRNYIPNTDTDEAVRNWVVSGAFQTLFLHPEELISPCNIDSAQAPMPFGFYLDKDVPNSMLLLTVYDADMVCLGYALYRY